MAGGLNKVMIIGNLVADAEIKYGGNGSAIVSFKVAVNTGRDNKAEFFSLVYFGETAEKVAQYLTKGKTVYAEGRQETRSWDGKDGQKVYRTEVIVGALQLLSSRD